METLDLSGTVLHALPDLTSMQQSLVQVVAREMMLTECGSLCAARFTELQLVDLSLNQILYMNMSLVTLLWPALGQIDIPENNITTLDDLRSIPVQFSDGIWFSAGGNPYSCDEEMTWIMDEDSQVRNTMLISHT